MGNPLSDAMSGAVGGLISSIGNTVAQFIDTPDKRNAMTLALNQQITDRFAQIEQSVNIQTQAQAGVTTAELTQGDNYTKRARPTLVYFGMVVIAFNYCVIPTIQLFNRGDIKPFDLPVYFWEALGGVVATWAIGRSWEKINGVNGISSIITGSNK
jgi:hypothetical protein